MPRTKIAVARDEAFCFLYRDNLDLLADYGAELIFFSPLHDDALPAGAQGLILPGGYPELYARALTRVSQAVKEYEQKLIKAGGAPLKLIPLGDLHGSCVIVK